MIPRTLRLPMGPQVLQHGQVISSPCFLLKYKPNKEGHHRFGVVVSVKAGKTAVIRHIIKRAILAQAGLWPVPAHGGYDMLFIASPRLSGTTKQALKPLLRAELEKVRSKLL